MQGFTKWRPTAILREGPYMRSRRSALHLDSPACCRNRTS